MAVDMQEAIDFIKSRMQQLEPTMASESERNQLQYKLSFWSLLQAVNDSTPYTHLLPVLDRTDPFFDAALLSPAGVYLYYLLPYELTNLSVMPDRVVCSALGKETEFFLGYGRKLIKNIQRERDLATLPVYECYVVPEGGNNVRYVLEDTLILSFEHYPALFENFAFREHPAHQESQFKLLGYLISLISGPKEEVEAFEETPPLIAETDKNVEVKFTAVLDYSPSKLPPRQRRRKQKDGSWLHRLFTRK